MVVRGVVFDIGGVLEYTPDLQVRERWEERLDLPPGEIENRLAHVWVEGSYGRISEEEVLASYMELLEMDRPTADAFTTDLWVEYLGTPNEELLTYFRSLRSRCPTAILSNSFVGARVRDQTHIRVEELCNTVVYSHEVGFYKPERDIYLLTCEKLGLPPGQIAFLDDNPEYLRGAEDVGMHPIQFTENGAAMDAVEAWLR